LTTPRWNDPKLKAGTMIKGALWLVTEVGEGNVFTKEQLRAAFPGIAQVDRRIRDLRDYGWVIYTNTDDATLRPDEQRFVKAGTAVWKLDERRQARAAGVSAKERRIAFAADQFQCVVCGVAGGETYPDSPSAPAVLSVSRKAVRLPGGSTEEQMVTECKRCRAGSDAEETIDTGRLLSDIQDLDAPDRTRLLRWMERGRRGPTPLDRAWNAYRRLPAASRDEIFKLLRGR